MTCEEGGGGGFGLVLVELEWELEWLLVVSWNGFTTRPLELTTAVLQAFEIGFEPGGKKINKSNAFFFFKISPAKYIGLISSNLQ